MNFCSLVNKLFADVRLNDWGWGEKPFNDNRAKIIAESIAESLINAKNDSFTHFDTGEKYVKSQPLCPIALRTKRGKGQLCIMNVNLQFL